MTDAPSLDVRSLAAGLTRIESIALLPSVPSTNVLARRVLRECLENEVALPAAAIIALEQTAGAGRAGRAWHSPVGKGVWATILHTRAAAELPLLPLEVAVAIAGFLRDDFGVDARIKWPNDVFAGSRKIAGILIEARGRDDDALVLIGAGINVFPPEEEDAPQATSIAESGDAGVTLDAAVARFLARLDRDLYLPYDPARILASWRATTLHREGDRIGFQHAGEQIEGTWEGIDDAGRARIRVGPDTRLVAAGDLILFA